MTTRTRADGERDDDDRGGTLDFEAAMNKEFVRVEVPALLFPQQETLLPGTRLTLHLYEARFLALLEGQAESLEGVEVEATWAVAVWAAATSTTDYVVVLAGVPKHLLLVKQGVL